MKTTDVDRLFEADTIQKSYFAKMNVYNIRRTNKTDGLPDIILKCMVGNSQEKPNSSG